MAPLYLDYNASTPMDPKVFEAMKPWWLDNPGNAGSRTHVYGQRAKEAVEQARQQVAGLIGAKPEDVIFTSGATESNNIAILGLAEYGLEKGRRHILSTMIEHKAVLEPLERMRDLGFEVELVPVTRGGYIEADEVKKRLRPDTLLVSVMHANNETGVLQPLEEVSQLLVDSATLLHVDAAQTYGKEVEELKRLRYDLLSISGHKIYGPQGIGALYVHSDVRQQRSLKAIAVGGGQERGLRPGTVPVAIAVGLGKAADLAESECLQRRKNALAIKCALLDGLCSVEHRVNGDPKRTQAHVLNVTFPDVDSEALMVAVKSEMAISNGSACTSSSYTPSHVLQAMGLDDAAIECSVRMSWGQGLTTVQTESFVAAVALSANRAVADCPHPPAPVLKHLPSRNLHESGKKVCT